MQNPARCPSATGTGHSATAFLSPRPSRRFPTWSCGGSTPHRVPSCSPDMTEDSSGLAGESDGFGRLWTPHRMVYIQGENRPAHAESGVDCPFCLAPQRSDEDGLIVARGELVYAVLNLYPYNSGHLMTVPYRHVPDYTDLTVAETADLGAFTQRAM